MTERVRRLVSSDDGGPTGVDARRRRPDASSAGASLVDVSNLHLSGGASGATRIRRTTASVIAPVVLSSVSQRVQRKGGDKDTPSEKKTDPPVNTASSWSFGGVLSGAAGYVGSYLPAWGSGSTPDQSTADKTNGGESKTASGQPETKPVEAKQVATAGKKPVETNVGTKPSDMKTGQHKGEKVTGETQVTTGANPQTAQGIEPDTTASESKRPTAPKNMNGVNAQVKSALAGGSAAIDRAAIAKVDSKDVLDAIARLEKAQKIVLPKTAKEPARANHRARLWNAAHDLDDVVAAFEAGPLAKANESTGWLYRNKVNKAKLTDAQATAARGHQLRVDVEALDASLVAHAAPEDGKVPDYHALLASLPAVVDLATNAKAAFVEPEKITKAAATCVPTARSAIQAADATLDADKVHARDSPYWVHLVKYRRWVENALTAYDEQMQATYPVWAEVDKNLSSMRVFTPQLLRERTQADAHLADRVGGGGVAVDVVDPTTFKGDGDGKGPSAERAALSETLKAIGGNAWKGMVVGGKWGTEFGNAGQQLPTSATYTEYYVRPPAGTPKKLGGQRRVIVGSDARRWYTWTHYGDDGAPAFVLLRGYGGVK